MHTISSQSHPTTRTLAGAGAVLSALFYFEKVAELEDKLATIERRYPENWRLRKATKEEIVYYTLQGDLFRGLGVALARA